LESHHLSSAVAWMPVPASVASLRQPLSSLLPDISRIRSLLLPTTPTSRYWRAVDVQFEQQVNRRLASCGAARLLVQDVVRAAATFDALISDGSSRQSRRILATTEWIVAFLGFASYVACLALARALENGTVEARPMLQATERSRMVTVTVETMLPRNSERVCRAISDYAQGSAVRALKSLSAIPSEKLVVESMVAL
jgi:hypothetical protein